MAQAFLLPIINLKKPRRPMLCMNPPLFSPADGASAAPSARTLVVIDGRIADVQKLLAGLSPDARVRVVGENEEGLAAISEALPPAPPVSG